MSNVKLTNEGEEIQKEQKRQETKEGKADEGYLPNIQDLLEEFDKTEEVVNSLRKINQDSGLEVTYHSVDPYSSKPTLRNESINTQYVQYQDPIEKTRRLRWVEKVTNRDGTYRKVDNLIASGTISPEEKEHFSTEEKIPRREVNQILRIKTRSGKEYITRAEKWYGLTATSSIVTCPVRIGSYVSPYYTTEFQKVDPENPNSNTVRVAKLGQPQGDNYAGETKYTEEYSEDKIRKYLKHTVGILGKDYSLALMNQNSANPRPYSCLDPERFAKEDFNSLWKSLTTRPPTVDLKALVTELRKPDKEVENEVYG